MTEEQGHSWDPAEYEFDPYNLTAVHVSQAAGSPSKDAGCSKDGSAEAAAAVGPPVKRRPGRQRRTSVLCQVREDVACLLARLLACLLPACFMLS